ncbi:MAG: hypothetical protein ACE5HE_06935 [Phycisphaerae bacterium]
MRRLKMVVAVAGVSLASAGCIATAVTKNRFGSDRELIAVNDQVYMVDKSTGKVMTVDVSSAVPFTTAADPD